MLEFLADAAVNTATGGIFGLVGTGISALMKGISDHQTLKHDIAMREMDLKVLETESKLRIKEITAKTEVQVEMADMELEEAAIERDAEIQKASYQADKATYGGGAVDAIRGLMRPAITILLVVAAFVVTYQLGDLSNEIQPSPEEAWRLFSNVVHQLLFLTATAVTWWFGSRPMRSQKN